MSRKLLIASALLVLVGLMLILYSSPALRLGLGFSGALGATFTSGNRTFTFTGIRNATGFAGGQFAGRGIGALTTLETLVGVGFVSVGLVLEVIIILLYQAKKE